MQDELHQELEKGVFRWHQRIGLIIVFADDFLAFHINKISLLII